MATGVYRGAGRPEAIACIERLMDRLAQELQRDPVEVRRRNFVQTHEFPYTTASRVTYDSGNFEGALDLLLATADLPALREQQRQERARGERTLMGIGLAAFVDPSAAGWESADDWAALFACAIIGANGCRLLFPALHEMLDTAPRGEIVPRIQEAARAVPGVVNVEKCLVRKMGLSFYVDLHVGVNGEISVRDGHRIAHEVKAAIKSADSRIADVLVHIEPAGS